MRLEFSAESEAEIKQALDDYYNEQAALIPVLYVAQEQFGSLTPEALDLVAGRLNLPRMHVEGAASFYTMLYRRKVGRYHIQVCRTLSCALGGAREIVDHIRKKLDFGPDGVTADGKFSLEEVECLAMCGSAPAMIVNRTNYENLTVEKSDDILDGLK